MSSPHDDDAAKSATALDLNPEPGFGASVTDDSAPRNVTAAAAPLDGASAEAGAPLQGANVGEAKPEPEKERSAAKIAIIMFALGVRVILFLRQWDD